MTLAVPLHVADTSDDPSVTLDVSHLEVTYRVRGTDRLALRDISFQIGRQDLGW